MGIFPRGQAAEMSVNHSPPFHTDVKGRVELYLYSPSGPSRPVTGRNLPFLPVAYIFILPTFQSTGNTKFFEK
jgi:hypothetical protein